jgi:hypothetical protein
MNSQHSRTLEANLLKQKIAALEAQKQPPAAQKEVILPGDFKKLVKANLEKIQHCLDSKDKEQFKDAKQHCDNNLTFITKYAGVYLFDEEYTALIIKSEIFNIEARLKLAASAFNLKNDVCDVFNSSIEYINEYVMSQGNQKPLHLSQLFSEFSAMYLDRIVTPFFANHIKALRYFQTQMNNVISEYEKNHIIVSEIVKIKNKLGCVIQKLEQEAKQIASPAVETNPLAKSKQRKAGIQENKRKQLEKESKKQEQRPSQSSPQSRATNSRKMESFVTPQSDVESDGDDEVQVATAKTAGKKEEPKTPSPTFDASEFEVGEWVAVGKKEKKPKPEPTERTTPPAKKTAVVTASGRSITAAPKADDATSPAKKQADKKQVSPPVQTSNTVATSEKDWPKLPAKPANSAPKRSTTAILQTVIQAPEKPVVAKVSTPLAVDKSDESKSQEKSTQTDAVPDNSEAISKLNLENFNLKVELKDKNSQLAAAQDEIQRLRSELALLKQGGDAKRDSVKQDLEAVKAEIEKLKASQQQPVMQSAGMASYQPTQPLFVVSPRGYYPMHHSVMYPQAQQQMIYMQQQNGTGHMPQPYFNGMGS